MGGGGADGLIGECTPWKIYCDGDKKISVLKCYCEDNRQGTYCEQFASVKREYNCGERNRCYGHGSCAMVNAVQKGDVRFEKWQCLCNPKYSGIHCNFKRLQKLVREEGVPGDIRRSIAVNGGYFT